MVISNEITEEVEEEIYKVESEILQGQKPNIWNVHVEGNMERALEVDFAKFAISVSDLAGIELDNLSTFQFYASVEYLKEKHSKR